MLENCNCDIEAAFSEWSELKLYIKDNSKFIGKDPLCVWQRVSQEDAERQEYLNILKVVHLTSVYPLANAACERGFSTMKHIKSDWRCSLSNGTMDILMRVKLDGPETLADFKPKAAVNRWWMERNKRGLPSASDK